MEDDLEELAERICQALKLARKVTNSQGYKRVPKIVALLQNSLDEALNLQDAWKTEMV